MQRAKHINYDCMLGQPYAFLAYSNGPIILANHHEQFGIVKY